MRGRPPTRLLAAVASGAALIAIILVSAPAGGRPAARMAAGVAAAATCTTPLPTTQPPAVQAAALLSAALPAVGSVPTTSLGFIKGRVPTAPSTLPFLTRGSNAHVDPLLAKLSLGALALSVLIVAVQLVLTRPGRNGRRTL